ncbi:hypothetical protein A2Z33_01980 [Candidatus Gottesmanbacteria bacterium RBG_16_52_11]|uniref:Uncharacterized protein n=1 Tax=Candidatus Gottesmanbacteria bacterium RBG_16_52_11 TaxID=1798374 RepID=A0A1F5YR49_9BACT|nr:MAG: hypothetical protein A2Z33_01980 [Candidatus Gottesmanbacteria bacterium RBG_16_52_11]
MNKTTALVSAIVLSLGVFTAPAYAATCTGQYGETFECATDIFINKMVQDPVSGQYVENVTDARFSKDDKVVFRLTVKNSAGDDRIDTKVTDSVPDNLVIDDVEVIADGNKWVTISSDKKSMEVKIEKIGVGKEITIYLWTHLVGPYPTEPQFCRDNWATVKAPDKPEDTNFARFCVGAPAKELPKAGVEDMLYMAPFALTALGGMALFRKKA